jgi:hypothetical protein
MSLLIVLRLFSDSLAEKLAEVLAKVLAKVSLRVNGTGCKLVEVSGSASKVSGSKRISY